MTFREFEKFCREQELRIFTISDVKVLFSRHSPQYIRLKLNRWKKKGYLKSPKNGLYIMEGAAPDEFEIASKLITPSYISLETALSHYSIVPEVSAEVSSVTTKNTRMFKDGRSVYKFYHAKHSLFFGFAHMTGETFIASPEKAILDFFYLRRPGTEHPFFERFNRQSVKELKLKIMEKMAKKFPPYVQNLFNYFKNAVSE